ncbi:hypothetical protein MASR2M78_30310 [Treponema sp.]
MISYILFDLDNTLYPSSLGLEDQVADRISIFVAEFLGMTPEAALKTRNEGIKKYGTTLEWLMNEKGLSDIETYYAAIHPEGEERLEPNPGLRAYILSLPVPSAVFTNSPIEHADRILKRLGMADIFTHIFDIRWGGLQGKPAESSFRRVLDAIGKKPEEVLFVDDLPHYVEGFIRIGGLGILLDEDGRHHGTPYPRIRSLYELDAYVGEQN